MLTKREQSEIEAEFEKYDVKRAACVEALKIVQRHRGWVSDESIRDLVPVLEMSAEELDGIATFYSMILREPVGEHLILICDSVSCWIMGYENLQAYLTERLGIGLGETTEDGKFTLMPVSCLGACDHAPVMMVDGELYLDVDREKIDEIIAKFR